MFFLCFHLDYAFSWSTNHSTLGTGTAVTQSCVVKCNVFNHVVFVYGECFVLPGIKKLRFKPAYNPYTEPSMEIFSYHEGRPTSCYYQVHSSAF